MKTVGSLVKRNVKLFFKDKGTFFTALITPIILMVLYATFLYKVYEESFTSSLPEGVSFMGDTLQGLVGGLLLSSLLSVTPVTVSFCANLCMVADKVSGARGDIGISPVKPRSVAVSYYLSTVINGMIISLAATLLGCVYLAFTGWYLTVGDILCLLFDVTLLVLFGTAISSLICYPLTTQGQLSAVGSIVSSGYGFICGAYMPISSFSKGLQNTLSFLPGTHGTSLLRNHALTGVFEAMTEDGMPTEAVDALRAVSDCQLSFFGHDVEKWVMYLVLVGAVVLLVGAYVLITVLAERKNRK